MDNGCSKCEEISKNHIIGYYLELCLDCQLAHAEWEVIRWMNRAEEIKKKIEEQENE